ncbi:MAG TPA: GNAT family N-acetyltransferase [Anaerolineae bacterium]|nr:GNAT family N-acetyltransferase [Anaerolineae bacterium]
MDRELTIRPAKPDDRSAMERICANTWEWGDYIPEVWDDWLAANSPFEGGIVLVGELDGQVVALSRITFETLDQVWLEGMRVDPDYRRQGIAGRFLDYSLAYAQEQGARVVRLGTGHYNEPVHTIVAHAGMEHVGAYVLWTSNSLPDGFPSSQPQRIFLGPDHVDQVQAFLAASPVLAHTRGLYSADWAWQELSARRINQFLEAGQMVARFAPDGQVLALATVHFHPGDDRMWVGFADGEPAAVSDLATDIRAYAAERGAQQVGIMLLDLDWLRDAFRTTGYGPGEWEGELWIFERLLSPKDGDKA